nr:hypothetical protein [Tanacetum cinerariifolium]
MCEMVGQFIQKKEKEKQIEEDQAANARYWKIPACCDDDDDYNFAITPNEPVDSLSMGDEHLNTISTTESDKFIKSSVENLVPNPSESKGENGCDVPACFTTFSNILFDADYDFYSSDDQSLYDEDVLEKIFSNPLFKEEIIPMKIDQHHDNAESDLVESLRTHDSSLIISSKIDSLLDEFAGELTLLKSIPLRIDETDCDPEKDIRLIERLLYDNSSPRPPKEFVSKNSNAKIESFYPSPIPIEDSDSLIDEIDLSITLDDPIPPGIEEDDYDSERDILILEELLDNYSLSLLENESFHFDIPSSSRPPAKPPYVLSSMFELIDALFCLLNHPERHQMRKRSTQNELTTVNAVVEIMKKNYLVSVVFDSLINNYHVAARLVGEELFYNAVVQDCMKDATPIQTTWSGLLVDPTALRKKHVDSTSKSSKYMVILRLKQLIFRFKLCKCYAVSGIRYLKEEECRYLKAELTLQKEKRRGDRTMDVITPDRAVMAQ